MQPDHVRVIQRGQYRRLGPEHLGEPLIGQQIPAQVLDRHLGPRLIVPGQHHITETARAERLHRRIPRKPQRDQLRGRGTGDVAPLFAWM